jgi:DNA polymerase-3 subunit beta
MNILLSKESLLILVNNLSRVVQHSAHIPALQGIYLEVKKNTLTCSATNIEMSVTAEVEGEEGMDGVCVVPARVLVEVLKNTRGDKVNCMVKDGVLYIKNGSGVHKGSAANTKITLLPHEEFPKTPLHTTETTYSIPAPVFVQGFTSTLFAVSPSTIKPELACVSVKQSNDVLVFASTDSFRLAEKKVQYQGEDEVPSLLVPGKNAQELVYFLSLMGESEVLWYFDEHMVGLRAGDYYVTSRLVNGTYPDYTRIIPKETTTVAQFITNDLQYVFKKASLFSDVTRQISIELVPEKNECLFRAKNATVGEFEESIPAKITGDSLGLNFNSKYVSDCLGYIKEEGVECKFAGPGRPLVMKGVNNESFLYLVMPMNR